MKTIEMRYGVRFGTGDGSDWIEFDYDIDGEAEKAYDLAVETGTPLDSVPELESVLAAAYKEIEEQEIESLCDYDDEYVLECQGRVPVDADRVNELVHQGDPLALEFFELEDLSPEELEEWDAEFDMIDEPMLCEIDSSFKPISPFDGGYTLYVEFVDPNE